MDDLLRMSNRPTAIVASAAELAIPLLHVCWRQGLQVPGQLSVASFNDISFAHYSIPPLTTVRVPTKEMGTRAAEALLAQIGGAARNSDEKTVLECDLSVRASTAPPAQ